MLSFDSMYVNTCVHSCHVDPLDVCRVLISEKTVSAIVNLVSNDVIELHRMYDPLGKSIESARIDN